MRKYKFRVALATNIVLFSPLYVFWQNDINLLHIWQNSETNNKILWQSNKTWFFVKVTQEIHPIAHTSKSSVHSHMFILISFVVRKNRDYVYEMWQYIVSSINILFVLWCVTPES